MTNSVISKGSECLGHLCVLPGVCGVSPFSVKFLARFLGLLLCVALLAWWKVV